MTSLFMGLMENYGNFSTVEEKQNYFAAVSAYMVSGGLHSLHEVIGPAQFSLDLIPGYRVSAPMEHLRAAPPNFHQFYQQQMDVDPEFRERYEQGWQHVMTAYATQAAAFVHAPISDVSIVQQRVADTGKTPKVSQPFAEKTEEQALEILEKNPSLKAINIDVDLISDERSRNRANQELYIKNSLMKINIYSIRGDEAKVQEAIDSLYKTVCMQNNFFKKYSTSTPSAIKLINTICNSKNLSDFFGINGNNHEELEKEIKARMEAACDNEAIPTPDFSRTPRT